MKNHPVTQMLHEFSLISMTIFAQIPGKNTRGSIHRALLTMNGASSWCLTKQKLAHTDVACQIDYF